MQRPGALPLIQYVVDGQNRRIGKKVGGTLTTGWLYQSQLAPIAELNGSGAVVSRFIYASRPNVPDLMLRGGVTYRLVTDHLGSVRLVINTSTNTVVQRTDYDEFGQLTAETLTGGFVPVPFGFAGGLLDRDTQLTRFGARDYDPKIGRWTSKDGSLEGGLNLYAFASNDPLNYVDIDGRNPILAAAIVGAAVGAGTDILLQLIQNGGSLACLNWSRVGQAALVGAALGGVTEWALSAIRIGVTAARGLGSQHIVLGLRDYGLAETAERMGGTTLLNNPAWRTALQDAIANPSTTFSVSVEGLSGASTYSKVLNAAQRGLSSGASPTNWELGQLYQAGRLSTTNFVDRLGNLLANPF